ncbi:MAG: hypothetical protein WCY10_03175 [Candidatus Omnitrophota bacterium]
MRSKFTWVIALLVFMFTMEGCASMTAGNADRMLEPAATLRYPDIPVPAGFNLLSQQSYSFENAGIRVALMKYKGRGTLDQVLNFYKAQMPISNWNLLNISEFGNRMLNFERDTETCIITMQPQFGGSTLIALSLGPKSAGNRNKRLPDEALK